AERVAGVGFPAPVEDVEQGRQGAGQRRVAVAHQVPFAERVVEGEQPVVPVVDQPETLARHGWVRPGGELADLGAPEVLDRLRAGEDGGGGQRLRAIGVGLSRVRVDLNGERERQRRYAELSTTKGMRRSTHTSSMTRECLKGNSGILSCNCMLFKLCVT